MKEEAREARRARIEAAAYEILARKGYAGCSMLSIAKQARCSNETLYNWYGDKVGLFRALVERNAEEARQLLTAALSSERPAMETLEAFGPLLLGILLGDKAMALNRAAAADSSGELAQALSEAGRETIEPLVRKILATARQRGEILLEDETAAAELYLGLLIGDLQIRRVIGRLPQPGREALQARSERALRVLRIWGDGSANRG